MKKSIIEDVIQIQVWKTKVRLAQKDLCKTKPTEVSREYFGE